MLDKIREILGEYVDFPIEQITPKTNLLTDLELNSLDMVHVVADFEEAFEIEIPDRRLSEIVVVEDVIRLLSEDYGIE